MVYQLVFSCGMNIVFFFLSELECLTESNFLQSLKMFAPLIISANWIIDEIKCQNHIVLLIV